MSNIPEGPGYLDYGSDAFTVAMDRLKHLGEPFLVVGDINLPDEMQAFVRVSKSTSFKNRASAFKVRKELVDQGITNILLVGEVETGNVDIVFSVPELTIHHIRGWEYKEKGVSKRNLSSSGEVLPDGVSLLAEAMYEEGGIPEIPPEALYEKVAEVAKLIETPMGFAYPAVLTAACGYGIEASGGIRPTLFTSLLGAVGSGKSVTAERTVDLFLPNVGFDGEKGDLIDPRNLRDVPASDQGLFRILSEAKGQPRLLNMDEGRAMLLKAKIDGSSLAPVLCQLFNLNYAGGADKVRQYSLCVKLSILLNVAVENPAEFSQVYGFATAHGLYDRSIFGVHPVNDYQMRPWTRPEFHFTPSRPSVSNDVYITVNAWGDKTYRRLRELALRIAYVSCAIAGDHHVTDKSITCALAFMEWQKRLRVFYQAAKGADEHQECVAAVLEAFRKRPGKCGNMRKMALAGNWYHKFPRVLPSVLKLLETQGVLCKDVSSKQHFLNESIEEKEQQHAIA